MKTTTTLALTAAIAAGAFFSAPFHAEANSFYYDNHKGNEDMTVTIEGKTGYERNETVKAGEGREIHHRPSDRISDGPARSAPGGHAGKHWDYKF